MYLKRIEIYGFKSFADRIELDFDRGITAVVGPNGSGKSNIADAIKWVLGEQKIKSLRGSKMEDVIFAGTIARKPLGYAEVTLVLDNSQGVLALEYDEISVTRRLYRSGESEYLINKTPCRLKDIQELFADTGLGKEGYSIIGQGKIDSIVSSNPQDIRHLFDEAAGIVKFKNRKQESERKLERTVDNIHRVTDIVTELEKQLGPLKRQRKKAQIYLEHAEELKKIQLNVFVNRTEQLDAQLNDLTQQHRESQIQLEEKKRQTEEADNTYQALRREIGILEAEIDEINETMLDLSQRTERFNTEIQVSRTNMKNAADRIRQYEEEKAESQKKIQELTSLLEQNSNEKEEHKKKWDQIRLLVEESLTEKETLEEAIRIKRMENRSREWEMQKMQETLQKLDQETALAKSNVEYAGDRIETLKDEYQSMESEVEVLVQRKEKALQQKKEWEEVLRLKETELEEQRNQQKERREQRSQLSSRRSLLNNNLASEKSKLHMLEEDQDAKGYYRSVKNLLSHKQRDPKGMEGMRDIAGNLLKVDPEYAIAIETAMGGSFQHIVVDNDRMAQKCIGLLNEKKWGRATFLPLNAVKGKREVLPSNMTSKSGVLGLAIDLISFDSEYEGIFSQILGKTLIVDDLETGLEWSRKNNYRGKIVTRKGEVFHPGGAIVGGTFNKNNLLLQRNNRIESLKQNILEMTEEWKQVEQQLDLADREIQDLEVEIKDRQTKVHNVMTELRLIDQGLESLDKDQASIRQRMEKHEKSMEDNQDKIRSLQEKIQDMDGNRKKIQEDLQHQPVQDESEQDDDMENQLRDCTERLNSRRIEAARIETQYRGMEKQEMNEKIRLEEAREQNHRKDQQILELKEMIQQGEEGILNKSDFMNDAESQIARFKEDLAEKQKKRKEKNQRFDYLESQLKGYNHEQMLLNETIGKLDVKINANELEKEHLSENIFEDYQMTYLMAKEYRYPVENMELEMKNAKALKDKIKGLGNINLAAIDQYKEVHDRHAFLTEQREDLLKAREELKTMIKDISKDIQVQFVEQFTLIQAQFNQTFKRLFNGGNAGLLIVDDEDILDTGIEIVAQPPGKKLKNITLLSGGEKSLTAIALLFAIIRIKPAPFCVLDEIDAALDDSNVDRFAHFLAQLNKENQFITITHRKGTMETADRLYGVTMGRDGVSKMLSVQLSDIV